MDEKLAGLIKGLRSEGLTRKTERAIEQGARGLGLGCSLACASVGLRFRWPTQRGKGEL